MQSIIEIGAPWTARSRTILIQVLTSNANPAMSIVLAICLSGVFGLNSTLGARVFKVVRILSCLNIVSGEIIVINGLQRAGDA